MSARILIVDDVADNRQLLEAKLSAEYFSVATAGSGPEALLQARATAPDLILLDVMMPEMDGYETCRRLRADALTAHIPIIMLTALTDREERIRGLRAGADDFLSKPIDDIALFARTRSLLRLKLMMDELRLRQETIGQFDIALPISADLSPCPGRILVVEDREHEIRNLRHILAPAHDVSFATSHRKALDEARNGRHHLIIVNSAFGGYDALRLCAEFRGADETRQVALLIVVPETAEGRSRLVRALDIGVNDYLVEPVDREELLARVETQLHRRRYEDQLRARYHLSLAQAVTDGLTGLHNRNFMETHLAGLLGEPRAGKETSLLMLDIDHFKAVNDQYGHAAGDEILKQFAERLARNIRSVDLGARYGGEEFVVIMPDTPIDVAARVAERLRRDIAARPFEISAHESVPVTVSIGVASVEGAANAQAALLQCADRALYTAKERGRNKTVTMTPAEVSEVA